MTMASTTNNNPQHLPSKAQESHSLSHPWVTTPGFIGREELLNRIPEHLMAGHVLLTGESGMGKSALMDALNQRATQQRQQIEQQWVDGIIQQKSLPPLSYTLKLNLLNVHDTLSTLRTLNQGLMTLAEDILATGLQQANTLNKQIGVHWTEDDLLKAIGLIKLQEEVDQATEPGMYIPKERIANALKSAMPVIKRFHFSSVNHCIKQLVQQLQDPWLYAASQLLTPTNPRLAAALKIHTPDMDAPNSEQILHQISLWNARTQWLHQTLPSAEPRIHIFIDHWEHLLKWEKEEQHLFYNTLQPWLQQNKPQGIHTLISCRSEAISQALPTHILNQIYRTCIVPRLSYRTHKRFILELFQKHPVHINSDATDQFIDLTSGNPYWTTMLSRYIGDRLLATGQEELTEAWVQSLGLTSAHDVLETTITQIKLSNMPYEADALRIMASVIRYAGLEPFEPARMAQAIHHDQNLSLDRVNTVLNQMLDYGLLCSSQSEPRMPETSQVNGRIVQDYILETCRWIDTELTVDAQIRYLKKIIPLSVQSGELNRDKTQEVIALSTSTGQQELIQFLEETFTEHLSHPAEKVRTTALNNLAMLHTQTSLEGILSKLHDPSPTVQECALRSITYLCEKTTAPDWLEQITQNLLPKLDEENTTIRSLAYHTLSNLPINHHSQQLTAVYLKALADHEQPIRELAMKQLKHADQQSAWVRHATLDALYDSSDDIRHQACMNLQHNSHPKVLEALGDVLESDTNPTIRALAAKMLAKQGTTQQRERLIKTLNKDLDDNVQVTILRALQHFPDLETEQFIIEFTDHILNNHPSPNTLLWASVQTLSHIAQHPASAKLIQNILERSHSPIVTTAAESALLGIQSRLSSSASTPISNPTPSSVIDIEAD